MNAGDAAEALVEPRGRAGRPAFVWDAVERVAALSVLRERAEAMDVAVRVRVQHGDIAGVILLHARAQAPDLIVLGSHHQPVGLARLRYRSIPDGVVKGAACPVLLVPAATAHATPAFRNIICAVDLSSRSAAMITNVSRFAEDGGRLAFLHVLPDSVRRRYGRFAVAQSSRAMALDARQRLHTMLDTQGLESEVLVTVSSKSVHDEILHVASARKADLIVVGATRRAGLRRRFLGSTALRLSRRSALPVLILPAVHVKRELSTLDEAVLGWAA